MRSHIALTLAASLVLVVGSANILRAQSQTPAGKPQTIASPVTVHEASYFTVSGGALWPAGGPVQDTYQPGVGVAASFRKGLIAEYMGGLEFGYSWFTLDKGKLGGKNPGSTYSGGNMELLSITTENDYIFGKPGKTMRPFMNLGIGYYKSFIDDATVTTGSTVTAYNIGVYEGSFFGFHAGIGALVTGKRFGLRLDANYQHLFAGGPDLEYFTARGGIIFYMD
jgi:outer membrane protein W